MSESVIKQKENALAAAPVGGLIRRFALPAIVSMLVMQGAEAFYLWTGVRPNTDLMQRTLREELARRG